MNMSHRTELGIARRVAARREPWSADRLREVAALLAEAERVHDGASDFWQGRLADHLGFWRRVPGTAWHRPPARGQLDDEPADDEKAWKLVELRDALARIRREETERERYRKYLDRRAARFRPRGAWPRRTARGSQRRRSFARRGSRGGPPDPLDPTHPHLVKGRGLSKSTLDTFGVGYCARGTLRGTIAITVRDEYGDVVAYAARRLKAADIHEHGKYKLPKGFRRDLVLYNLDRARAAPREEGLVLVEGFFAAMTHFERGVPNAVASMGASLSERKTPAGNVGDVNGGLFKQIDFIANDPRGRAIELEMRLHCGRQFDRGTIAWAYVRDGNH